MKFLLDDMDFIFPYDKMYPEQYNYVCDLKRSLDAHVSDSHWFGSGSELLLTSRVDRVTVCWRCRPERARPSPCSR